MEDLTKPLLLEDLLESSPTKIFNKKTTKDDAINAVVDLVSNENEEDAEYSNVKNEKTLTILFIVMIVIGSANKIFSKLQTIPMYHYPNFLNLLTVSLVSYLVV